MKDFEFATGITLTEDPTRVHGNFVQIIAAHKFLDEMFPSATSQVVVSKQTPTHKNTKDLDKMEEMSGIQFRAAMHLIGASEVEKAVSEKHGSAEQISVLFHDNTGANQLKQRILGFNTETVEIHGKIDTNKDMVVNNPLEHSSTPEQRIDQPDNQVFKVGSVSALVYSADITTLKVDAIVNAANGNLSHGSGVARAIRDAAGDALDDEGRRYVHNNGPIPVSGVVRTTAGRMPCRMVLHAVGPAWYDYKDYDKRRCEDDLCKTILRCLIEATNAGAAIVAIPAISSGIFRVPKQKCCDAYVRATKLFGMWTGSKKCLIEVHYVDKSESMLQMIATTFSQSKHSMITPKPDEERFMKEYMQQGVRQRSRSRGRQTSSSPQGGQTTHESHAVSAVEASYTYSVDGKGVVKLYTGDIVKTSADALVTWENTAIQPITGASKAVREATGHIKLQGMQKDLLSVSSTHAGNMRDKKHIIHAIVPVSSFSLHDLKTLLKRILQTSCGTDASAALTPLTFNQVNLEDFAKAFCNITREVMKESRVPEIHLIEKIQRL
ncbi:protein mono-ADP-ribosyltransferase PARP14-like [Haliotis rubra]|uniref:protein mono-ADP-ribosyltransferase PARP14-like n=1 Tax=Haliotis rubra TaxID=36100 RepID=UPI001EE5A6B1|nr:protein mono-ADP-ribosyltransferase PARP14-like [Haliotis rubra]